MSRAASSRGRNGGGRVLPSSQYVDLLFRNGELKMKPNYRLGYSPPCNTLDGIIDGFRMWPTWAHTVVNNRELLGLFEEWTEANADEVSSWG